MLWISITKSVSLYPTNSHSTVWLAHNVKVKVNFNGCSISPWCSNPIWWFFLFTKHHNFRSNRKGVTLQYLSCPGNMLMARVEWFWSHSRNYDATMLSISSGFWLLQQNSILFAIAGECPSLWKTNAIISIFQFFFFFLSVVLWHIFLNSVQGVLCINLNFCKKKIVSGIFNLLPHRAHRVWKDAISIWPC